MPDIYVHGISDLLLLATLFTLPFSLCVRVLKELIDVIYDIDTYAETKLYDVLIHYKSRKCQYEDIGM